MSSPRKVHTGVLVCVLWNQDKQKTQTDARPNRYRCIVSLGRGPCVSSLTKGRTDLDRSYNRMEESAGRTICQRFSVMFSLRAYKLCFALPESEQPRRFILWKMKNRTIPADEEALCCFNDVLKLN
jgi:hypothetical protein